MTAPAPAPSMLISKENIKVAAETVGVELADDVIKTLCQEVEYRVREITQVRFALDPLQSIPIGPKIGILASTPSLLNTLAWKSWKQ